MGEVIDLKYAKLDKEVMGVIDNMHKIDADYEDAVYYVVKNADKLSDEDNRSCVCGALYILMMKNDFIEKVKKIKENLKVTKIKKGEEDEC